MNQLILQKPIQSDWKHYQNFATYIAEPKYDGMRLVIEKEGQVVRLLHDRNLKNLQFPEIEQAAKGLPDGTTLDGELVIPKDAYSADFPSILTRNTTNSLRIKMLSAKIPAKFYAFDCIRFNGEDIKLKTLTERKQCLSTMPVIPRIEPVKMFTPQELSLINMSNPNMEGIILKNPNSTYNGINAWMKFKNYVEGDFIVTGHTSETRMISALELVDKDGNYVGKVNYTGYPQTDDMAKNLKGKIAVVQYMRSEGKLRFPVLKELRG